MATTPMPDSAERPNRDERRASSPRPSRVVETAQPVDPDVLAEILRAEKDQEWQFAGRGD